MSPHRNLLFWTGIFLSLSLSLGISLASAASSTQGYRIGPEDILSISIMAGGEEQIKTETVVGGNGYLTVPFVGKIKAQGLSLKDLEQAVYVPLEAAYFVDPQVHIQIKEYHSLQFFISGAVKKPGMFELDYTPTIMDLIASAEGVLPERGNLAYILRGVTAKSLETDDMEASLAKTEPIKVDLIALLDEGNMTENRKLKSGDTIYIPLSTQLNQATTKVYVQGKVKKPGVFDYQPGITALAACIMAGGFDKFAAPNRAKVIRRIDDGQKIIKLNLDKVQTGEEEDLALRPGDRIHIPESWL